MRHIFKLLKFRKPKAHKVFLGVTECIAGFTQPLSKSADTFLREFSVGAESLRVIGIQETTTHKGHNSTEECAPSSGA